MKNFIIKFMITYTAMLGIFCITYFGLNAVANPSDQLGIAVFACIMSIATMFITNVIVEEIQSKIS